TALLADVTSEEQQACIRDIGWHCYYLFALLPAHKRLDYAVIQVEEEICSHFDNVRVEYDQSKKTLIEGTLRYAIRLARHYLYSGVPYLDLVQEGVIGLMQASEKFEERAGGHFQSYAASWIKQRITRYIADHSRLIRFPVHQHENVKALEKQEQLLAERTGRNPSEFDLFIVAELLSEADVAIIRQHERHKHFQHLEEKLKGLNQLIEYWNK